MLNIRNEEIFLQFSQKDIEPEIEHNENYNIYRIKLNNVYFSIDVILNDAYYLPEYFSENDEIKLYTGELDRFRNIVFNGYFPLSKWVFEPYNTLELVECGYIEEFPDIYVNTFSGLYLHLPIEENRTKLYLGDVYIIHKDMIAFLELFSVIDESYEQQEEVQKFKNQISDKNKQIEELQKQIGKTSKEISGKSETSYLNLIQSLKEVCLSEKNFSNQEELIVYISEKYQGYTGLSEANLRDKFSKANKIQ